MATAISVCSANDISDETFRRNITFAQDEEVEDPEAFARAIDPAPWIKKSGLLRVSIRWSEKTAWGFPEVRDNV